MHFQINGQDVTVDFYHKNTDHNEDFDCTEVVIRSPLLDHLGGEVIGTSFCHPNDQFNRRVGRRIALAKALYVVDRKGDRIVPRSFTRPFWEEYFKQIPYDKARPQKWVHLTNGEWVRMSEVEQAMKLLRASGAPA
jgi:hypothetical protein